MGRLASSQMTVSICVESRTLCHAASRCLSRSVTDVAPRTLGHMNKTPSLDFLVVHKGRITLHLEGGAKPSIGGG